MRTNEVADVMKRLSSIAATALALLSAGLAIYARDVIACSLVEYSDFEQIDKDIYVAPATSAEDRKKLLSLIGEAKGRVASIYGHLPSTPVIIAAMHRDSLKWFSSNEYGSTVFRPGRSYIVVGPKGHNTDVIAHELVHSGVFGQVGYWVRSVHIPLWFDEGVAMQVDFRKRYDLPPGKARSVSLDDLRYSWQFYSDDDDELTNHYAVAKAELKVWCGAVGDGSIQSLLKQLKAGADFDETYRKMRNNDG